MKLFCNLNIQGNRRFEKKKLRFFSTFFLGFSKKFNIYKIAKKTLKLSAELGGKFKGRYITLPLL